MAEFGVYLRQITKIDPIPDADKIEVATVGGYQCVVGKGTYTVGQTVLYIPENAILPDSLIAEMGLEGRLAGKQKNRVKAVKLRGVLSQGLVYAVDSLMFREEIDHAERLGVTKYVPVIPTSFSGQAIHADGIEPWVEVDAIKAMRRFDIESQTWHDPFTRRQVEATLKIHGTAFVCTWHADGRFFVSSKGMGKQHIAILEDDTNVYWRAVRAYGLEDRIKAIQVSLQKETVSLYGEVFGPGIQDLTYGYNTLGFACFDIKLDGRWTNPATTRRIAVDFDIPMVPAIFIGPYNYDKLVELAENLPPDIEGFVSPTQEGIVVRTTIEPRVMGKIVSSAYLTRKGGTEYN